MSSFSIEGMENLRRIMEDYPEKGYRRPVMAGFRKASTVVRKAMVASLPTSLKSLRKAIKGVAGKTKEPSYLTGIFANKGIFRNRRGKEWDPYQIGYWVNYGTLANRFSGHQFKTRRKKGTAAWKGGITPRLFMERAWLQIRGQSQKVFEETVDQEAVKFLEKNAYKR